MPPVTDIPIAQEFISVLRERIALDKEDDVIEYSESSDESMSDPSESE